MHAIASPSAEARGNSMAYHRRVAPQPLMWVRPIQLHRTRTKCLKLTSCLWKIALLLTCREVPQRHILIRAKILHTDSRAWRRFLRPALCRALCLISRSFMVYIYHLHRISSIDPSYCVYEAVRTRLFKRVEPWKVVKGSAGMSHRDHCSMSSMPSQLDSNLNGLHSCKWGLPTHQRH
jgi:hypothetical protein